MKPYYDAGGITIYHGDCLEVLPGLDPVDHVITDPPYGRDVYLRLRNPDSASGDPARVRRGGSSLSRPNSHHAATGHKPARLAKLAAGEIGYIDDLLSPVAVEIGRLARRWVVVFSDAETLHRWRGELEGAGLRYIRTGAWVKPDAMPQMTGDRPGTGFEPCTICHAPGPMRWNGGGRLAVWTHFTAKGSARPDHPCPKPLPLMVELISQFTDPGDLVLDPFGGSGTTAAAAKHNGRRCILIERDEKHAETSARRCEAIEPGAMFEAPRARSGDLLGGLASA